MFYIQDGTIEIDFDVRTIDINFIFNDYYTMSKIYLIKNKLGNAKVDINENKSYITTTRNDITMLIIDKEDLETVLSKSCGCDSCGNLSKCFRVASLDEIMEWTKDG